ncbi:hypothetical protein NP233_g11829 [Leucocoprinus birnbaumii]|uniref:Uncharacterized protein n=1 Tax=Leucocoprinus birnbaumii TaxID=56174 RepID=A0AAD5YKZ7_9AGAR|nr:hypothetical protein NP233_g11829 [Leucocoprinus birnbaumii]
MDGTQALFEGLCDGLTEFDLESGQQQSAVFYQACRVIGGDDNLIVPAEGATRVIRAFEVENGSRNVLVGPAGPQTGLPYEEVYQIKDGNGNNLISPSRPELVDIATKYYYQKGQNEAPTSAARSNAENTALVKRKKRKGKRSQTAHPSPSPGMTQQNSYAGSSNTVLGDARGEEKHARRPSQLTGPPPPPVKAKISNSSADSSKSRRRSHV